MVDTLFEEIQTAKQPRFNLDHAIFDLMDALRSPVLTHSSMWINAIPKRILDLIPMARMMNLMTHTETATDPELVAFIMTRSFEAPMTSEWADIYTHISCKVLQDNFGEDHWDQVKAPRELTDYQIRYSLQPLRDWIYKRRRMAMKAKMKTETPDKNVQAEVRDQVQQLIEDKPVKIHQTPTVIQGELFSF